MALNFLIGLVVRVIFAYVAIAIREFNVSLAIMLLHIQVQLTVNYKEFNVSLATMFVISSHGKHENDVSERNVC